MVSSRPKISALCTRREKQSLTSSGSVRRCRTYCIGQLSITPRCKCAESFGPLLRLQATCSRCARLLPESACEAIAIDCNSQIHQQLLAKRPAILLAALRAALSGEDATHVDKPAWLKFDPQPVSSATPTPPSHFGARAAYCTPHHDN